nr:unnamed protein product [Spirometra erinaceieuropaei]
MVEIGVPQGSVLGAILFFIYVDDAARYLDCEVAMFADDMNIWNVIRGPADEDRLQMNLNRLEEWPNHWLLRFNVGKCGILCLGNTARSASTRDYFLGGATLQEVEAQKDLDVPTTSSLKPSAHCSRVAKTAMCVLYAIKHPLKSPTKSIVSPQHSQSSKSQKLAISIRKGESSPPNVISPKASTARTPVAVRPPGRSSSIVVNSIGTKVPSDSFNESSRASPKSVTAVQKSTLVPQPKPASSSSSDPPKTPSKARSVASPPSAAAVQTPKKNDASATECLLIEEFQGKAAQGCIHFGCATGYVWPSNIPKG